MSRKNPTGPQSFQEAISPGGEVFKLNKGSQTGNDTIHTLQLETRLAQAIELVRSKFRANGLPEEILDKITLENLKIMSLPGNQMAEAMDNGDVVVAPETLLHPVVRIAYILSHELCHFDRKVMSEAVVDAVARSLFANLDMQTDYAEEIRQFLSMIEDTELTPIQVLLMSRDGEYMQILEAILKAKTPQSLNKNGDLESLLETYQAAPDATNEVNETLRLFFEIFPDVKISASGVDSVVENVIADETTTQPLRTDVQQAVANIQLDDYNSDEVPPSELR